jgi:hypothetical protein
MRMWQIDGLKDEYDALQREEGREKESLRKLRDSASERSETATLDKNIQKSLGVRRCHLEPFWPM